MHGNKKYLAKQLDKSIINGTIDSKKYQELLDKRIIVDASSLDPRHKSLPIKGKAGSIVDLMENGIVTQRRIYGHDGKAIVDFDTNDHYKPKFHKTGAHKHTFDYIKKNPRSSAKKITDYELELNKDIIQKGVNYFDV